MDGYTEKAFPLISDYTEEAMMAIGTYSVTSKHTGKSFASGGTPNAARIRASQSHKVCVRFTLIWVVYTPHIIFNLIKLQYL